MKRGGSLTNKHAYTPATTAGSSQFSVSVLNEASSSADQPQFGQSHPRVHHTHGGARDLAHHHDHAHTLYHEHQAELSRVRDVMRAQQDEFQMQVAELHHLLDRQRDIFQRRPDIANDVVEAYCKLPSPKSEFVKEG